MRPLLAVVAMLLACAAWAAGNPSDPQGSSPASPPGGGKDMGAMHAGMAKAADVGDVKVPKATGTDARTVAEIVTGRSALQGKNVVVRGKVVRITHAVMDKNWIHLRDGSGSAADATNDLVVTTTDDASVGAVVVVKGVVRTDIDLGSGYAFKVLVEDAKLGK